MRQDSLTITGFPRNKAEKSQSKRAGSSSQTARKTKKICENDLNDYLSESKYDSLAVANALQMVGGNYKELVGTGRGFTVLKGAVSPGIR